MDFRSSAGSSMGRASNHREAAYPDYGNTLLGSHRKMNRSAVI